MALPFKTPPTTVLNELVWDLSPPDPALTRPLYSGGGTSDAEKLGFGWTIYFAPSACTSSFAATKSLASSLPGKLKFSQVENALVGWIAGANFAVAAASFAELRIATTSALVTCRHTAPGPTTSSTDVTLPSSSTVTLTRTFPPSPLSRTSFGGCSCGIETIFRVAGSALRAPDTAFCP